MEQEVGGSSPPNCTSPYLPHVTDRPNVFAPPKIQGRIQMALRMVALSRAGDKRWFARKGIPEDIRGEYARLYGIKSEAHLKPPADTPRHEAKTRLGESEAEIETRIATLRAKQRGEGRPLTRLNAIALPGRWYNWSIKQYKDDPGPPKRRISGTTSSGTCCIPTPQTATSRTRRLIRIGSGPEHLRSARP